MSKTFLFLPQFCCPYVLLVHRYPSLWEGVSVTGSWGSLCLMGERKSLLSVSASGSWSQPSLFPQKIVIFSVVCLFLPLTSFFKCFYYRIIYFILWVFGLHLCMCDWCPQRSEEALDHLVPKLQMVATAGNQTFCFLTSFQLKTISVYWFEI